MSEAGVGKSRLLYEFRKAVSNEDVTFMEGKCLSYSRGVAYHPVIDIVKSNFDIAESDGDLETREKLQRGLKFLDTDESSTLPYLLELLAVKDSGIDPISMSPEARKDRIIGALNRITIKASQIRPVNVPARIYSHMGCKIISQSSESEPAFKPGKPCYDDISSGNRRD
jgi:predicted ATPase